MDEDELLKKLNEGYYEEAVQYFETERKYDIVIDELRELFFHYNNKYVCKSKISKLHKTLWDLNRPERKNKKTCPYCNKEMLVSNYTKHFKTKSHINKYGIITEF